jgi:hypothetical protein
MPPTSRTPARSTTSTSLTTTGPTSPQGIANFIITVLTDATIYIQEAYHAGVAEQKRKKDEEQERALNGNKNWDEDEEVQSLMGDQEAEEGRRHPN